MKNEGNGTLALEFIVTLKAVSAVSRLKYQILLKSVEMQPVDVAEAKNRDLEDKLLEIQMTSTNDGYEASIAELQDEVASSKALMLVATSSPFMWSPSS